LADQLVQCDETDVGPAQEGICGAATGDVDHGKAGVLDQAGGETVAAAGDDAGAAIGEKLTELGSAFDDDFPLLLMSLCEPPILQTDRHPNHPNISIAPLINRQTA
jgi:hypothetical protein